VASSSATLSTGMPNLAANATKTIEKHGGVEGIVREFMKTGYGQYINSWVSKGPNRPISADQIQQALGSDKMEETRPRRRRCLEFHIDRLSNYCVRAFSAAGFALPYHSSSLGRDASSRRAPTGDTSTKLAYRHGTNVIASLVVAIHNPASFYVHPRRSVAFQPVVGPGTRRHAEYLAVFLVVYVDHGTLLNGHSNFSLLCAHFLFLRSTRHYGVAREKSRLVI
jgi:YidB-like protein